MNSNPNEIFGTENPDYNLSQEGSSDLVISSNLGTSRLINVNSFLPSPTYELQYLPQSKEQAHSNSMQIYEPNNFNVSNAHHLMQSTLPVLTPLNLNLKYVEYQANCSGALSSESESDLLDSDSRTRAKKSLPHKKRLKKLNSDQFSINPDDEVNIRTVQSTPQFECTECQLVITGQLEFFMHLKDHYEPSESVNQLRSYKPNEEIDVSDKIQLNLHQTDDITTQNENLIIESLEEDSQDDIKMEEMNGDAFEFSEPEDMEDFRKEVAKVVETIAENPDHDNSWTYQMTDEISENNLSNNDIIEDYSLKNEQINENVVEYKENSIEMVNNDFVEESDDEEDNRPLNEVKFLLKKPTKEKKTQDKDEMELNECLKKINNFKCNMEGCNKTFNSRTALGYHLKTHNSEARKFICEQCGKKFLTNGALKVHLRLHTNERPYKCDHCPKSFRQWGDLRYHETSIHSGEKNHICEYCAKSFARKYSLVIHRRIHTNERNYKCTDCDKSFRASSYLVNHQRIHTGEKPHECKVCSKRFRVQGDLKRHTKIHDRVKGGNVAKGIKKQSTEVQNVDVKQETADSLIINQANSEDCTVPKKLKKSKKK